MSEMLVGAHMSIAGGIYRAIERGQSLKCRTVQIFLKNSNQWKAKILTEQDRNLFLEARENSRIHPVVAHDSYLINLASPNRELFQKSIDAFVEEMKRANFLGVPYLVMHPGAHMGEGMDNGIRRVTEALTRAFDLAAPPVKVLLENTAGQGTSIGYRFEHLAAILEGTDNAGRLGICFDTCHAFAAGYDIRTKRSYRETIREFDHRIGLRKILAFHVNDSKNDFGSRVDRHFHIGKGFIGLEAFRCLVNDERFAHIPKILETPKGKNDLEDRMNLDILRSLLRRGSKYRNRKSKVQG